MLNIETTRADIIFKPICFNYYFYLLIPKSRYLPPRFLKSSFGNTSKREMLRYDISIPIDISGSIPNK